jgi:UDP-N-acetylmuramate dehydrogenase
LEGQLQMQGRLLENEPMSKHTSWRVGGPADHYYIPAGLDDLRNFLETLPGTEPLFWLGLGSNLLVRDGGLRGTVIATSGALKRLQLLDNNIVRAEAGVASAKAARFSVDHDLEGAEFLAGIPGTIGGALAMNAGAFGGETWNIVESVETLDRHGNLRHRPASEFNIAYRHVEAPEGEWFVAAHFRLQPRDASTDGKAVIKSLLTKRGSSQPMQTANAGSVFKNPKGDHAARLIESCGLKGTCVGKACISDIHANFIINTGNASANDIEELIGMIRETVKKETGIELEPEVRIAGETR